MPLNSDNIYTSDIAMLTSLTRFNKFIDLTLTSLISQFSRTQNVHVIVILLVFAFLHTLVVSLFYFYQSFEKRSWEICTIYILLTKL